MWVACSITKNIYYEKQTQTQKKILTKPFSKIWPKIGKKFYKFFWKNDYNFQNLAKNCTTIFQIWPKSQTHRNIVDGQIVRFVCINTIKYFHFRLQSSTLHSHGISKLGSISVLISLALEKSTSETSSESALRLHLFQGNWLADFS